MSPFDPAVYKAKPMAYGLAQRIGTICLRSSVFDDLNIETLDYKENYLPISYIFMGLQS